jgi:UDP:flavonoid glycosyltransferase YjiC (YdhE family)
VIVLPDHGHINPVACVVSELKQAHPNYEIIFYGVDTFKDLIERTGCTYRSYSYYPPDEKYRQRPITESGLIFTFNPMASLCTRLLKLSDRILPELIADVEREKPDLIIYDVFALHAKYLLRSLKLRYEKKTSTVEPPPAIMFATTFAQKKGVYPAPEEMTLVSKRNLGYYIKCFMLIIMQITMSLKHGLDIINVFDFLIDQTEKTVIVTIFPEFQPKREKFQDMSFVGCCVAENVRKFEVNDPELKALIDSFQSINPLQTIQEKPTGDSKLIYASMGTVVNNNLFIFEHIVNMMRSFKLEKNPNQLKLILSTGKESFEQFKQTLASKGIEVPDNVIIQPSVPQTDILKRVSLFITHCGMNSASEAIYYGVPVVCIPIMVYRRFFNLRF